MKRFALLLLLLFTARISLAQDQVYSQFFNAPAYLNPALNGQFDGDLRLNLIYRSQWTNIPGPLNHYTFSVDYNVPRFGGGFGLMLSKASEGSAFLTKTNFSGIYSYSVNFSNSVLSFGIQAGFTNRKLDYNKLVFYDQLNADGIIKGGTTDASNLEFNNRFFFDSGAGVNWVIGSFMAGGSCQHLNKPDESFTGVGSPLPIRFNGHLSYRLALDSYDTEETPAIIPSVVYHQQATVKTYSAGMQYKNRGVNVGLWYRTQGAEQQAFVVSVILDLFVKRDYYDKIRLGISHDAITSKLGYGTTAGTTEGALSYETTFPGRNTSRIDRWNGNGKRCYDFY